MLASVLSATVLGVRGRAVTVEVQVSTGLPGFTIVGLPDESCREARDRVRAAVLSSGLTWPQRRVTVNLAPSNVRKVGSGLDLAIAVALMASTEVVAPESVRGWAFIGELGLDGSLRPVPGVVPMVAALADRPVVVALDNAADAAVIADGPVRCGHNLREVIDALAGTSPWPDAPAPLPPVAAVASSDLRDIRGHAVGRLALEVAAAGRHHLLMVGPPGAGKTMLAARLPGLLPALEHDAALAVTMIHSTTGATGGLVTRPPFRAPHHTASLVSLIGGGSAAMRPGEVAMAHEGVLFLDELAEFPPSVLDGLRQPLEEGVVRVDRARGSVEFPASFLLVAAMNPCPCGDGDRPGACRCPDSALQRYGRRVSGPLLDRFDLRIMVGRPRVHELMEAPPGESTVDVAARVALARRRALDRGFGANALIPGPRLDELAPLERGAAALLTAELTAGRLSARGLHRVRRVARTLSDLAGGGARVDADAVAMALQLRRDVLGLDRRVA